MRRLVAVAALTALVAGLRPVRAQSAPPSWSPELGVQGGFSRFKFAGTGGQSKPADFFDVPGFVGLAPAIPAGIGALYAIVPVAKQLAVEASFTTAQLSVARPFLGVGGLGATVASAGLRADYAITPTVYAAAGGTLGFVETSGQHETQLGVEAAAGYRLHLGRRLGARIEATWQSTRKAKLLPPWNTYSLLFGLSSRVATSTAPAATGPTRAPGPWQSVIGVAGGYSRIHIVGGNQDITVMSFPNWGTGPAASPLGAVWPTAPTLYVVVPLGGRLAVEPGIDFHRIQSSGTTVFSGNFAGRLDCAVSGGWYAAGGLNLHFIKATKGSFADTSKTAVSVPGVNLGWGYRFHLSGELAGRVEINYTMFKASGVLAQASNTVGLLVGAAMPLQ